MFNMPVFLLLSTVAVAANCIAIPKIVNLTEAKKGRDERKFMLTSALTNNIFLSVIAAAVGAYMAPKVGLSSPFMESLINLNEPHIKLFNLLLPASVNSIYTLLGILLIQIILVSRCFSLPDYFPVPISTKILKEGVIEEIIYRWGLIPTVTRILNVDFMIDTDTAILFAIFISALGSAVLHISDLSRRRFYPVNLAVLLTVAANFWGATIYGWLFARYGIAASILCHAIVILVSSSAYNFASFVVTEDTNR